MYTHKPPKSRSENYSGQRGYKNGRENGGWYTRTQIQFNGAEDFVSNGMGT